MFWLTRIEENGFIPPTSKVRTSLQLLNSEAIGWYVGFLLIITYIQRVLIPDSSSRAEPSTWKQHLYYMYWN